MDYVLASYTSQQLIELYRELKSYGKDLCEEDRDRMQDIKAVLCNRGWWPL